VTPDRLDHDTPVVCIAHGAFLPCRRQGEHRVTADPRWVKSVREHHQSPHDHPWVPAWEGKP
jgi:hypothetical protein